MSKQIYQTPYKAIQISGEQAATFLQGQLTANILDKSRAYLTAHCNLQGRMVSLFFLVPFEDGFYLIAPPKMLDIALLHLKKYAVFSKVNWKDLPDAACYVVQNTEPQGSTIWSCRSEQAQISLNLGFADLVLDLQATEDPLSPWSAIQAEWIMAGLPSLSEDLSEHFLPHDINLPSLGGVSFNKGCYLGQEIISRMHFKAKIKRHMAVYRLAAKHPITALSAITDARSSDKKIGIVIDCAIKDSDTFLSVVINDEDRAYAQYEGMDLVLCDLPYTIQD